MILNPKQIIKRIAGPAFAPKVRLLLGTIDRNQFYDVLSYEIMRKRLGERSVCVDVGCHTGSFLRWMIDLAPKGKFFAFEPLPELYKTLTEKFTSSQIQVFNLALSDCSGVVSFNHVMSNPAYSGLRKRKYDRPNESDRTITVRTELLDAIIGEQDQVDFIKIDVEGAELQVLRGGVRTISRCKPTIVFEHGIGAADCYGTKPEHVYDLLCGECGLHISLLDDWLAGRRPLSRERFREQFEKGLNYYYVAHPISPRP